MQEHCETCLFIKIKKINRAALKHDHTLLRLKTTLSKMGPVNCSWPVAQLQLPLLLDWSSM